MRVTEERESVIPTEAMTLVHYPLLKLCETTRLLKPSEYNDKAVALLIECHQTIGSQIPGAVCALSLDDKLTQSTQPNTTYKNQIKHGQAMFSAPGQDLNSNETDDLAQTRSNVIK